MTFCRKFFWVQIPPGSEPDVWLSLLPLIYNRCPHLVSYVINALTRPKSVVYRTPPSLSLSDGSWFDFILVLYFWQDYDMNGVWATLMNQQVYDVCLSNQGC